MTLFFPCRMFAIDNNGELRIRDLTSLNSTEAHIVVMAKDSGVPPRMVSGGTVAAAGALLFTLHWHINLAHTPALQPVICFDIPRHPPVT